MYIIGDGVTDWEDQPHAFLDNSMVQKWKSFRCKNYL